MTGPLFFVAIVVMGLIVVAILATPIFLVPAAVLLFAAIFAGPLLGALRRGSGDGGGVPSTEDASYEPVQQPRT
jgi:hypothetical protein